VPHRCSEDMAARILLLGLTSPTVGFFGLAPRRAAPRSERTSCIAGQERFPSLKFKQAFGIENEYQLNLGKSIDTLRRDYPHLLHTEPDFSIYTDKIHLSSSSSKHSIEGIKEYQRVFDVLRFLRNSTMVHEELGARLVVSDSTIRVRWNAQLTMRAPFAALPGLARDDSGRPIVYVDGVSEYEIDTKGFVYKHVLNDVVVTPPELQGAVNLALFAWPGGFSPQAAPQPAGAGAGAFSPHAHLESSVALGSRGRRTTRPRVPSPMMSARETPMERAARERAEDAERAERLREIRTPRGARGKGGGLAEFLSSVSPQSCESNYDCERPLVCCDLVVASICCSSGMMIGAPQSQLQQQAIPIPIPVEENASPPRDGRGDAGYPAGNGYPF